MGASLNSFVNCMKATLTLMGIHYCDCGWPKLGPTLMSLSLQFAGRDVDTDFYPKKKKEKKKTLKV